MNFLLHPIFLASVFFILGHTMGWFAGNAQFVWNFWKDKPVFSTLLFGTPAGLFFWYGTKLAYEHIESLWSVRFLAAALSYLIFPILTWYFMQESMFTLKTIISMLLAWSILAVQYYL
jgi:hypothetical protein